MSDFKKKKSLQHHFRDPRGCSGAPGNPGPEDEPEDAGYDASAGCGEECLESELEESDPLVEPMDEDCKLSCMHVKQSGI